MCLLRLDNNRKINIYKQLRTRRNVLSMEGDEIMSEQKKGQTNEEKQYLVRFNADTKSHLHVKNTEICLTQCPDKICTIFCPAEARIG